MERIIGIDLGTTNSVAAVVENGRPVVIPSAEGSHLTPSVVAFDGDGTRLAGRQAKRQAALNPRRTVLSIKRHMGSGHEVRIGDRVYTPQEISAMILLKVKTDVETYLGESVRKAVITVPAYFNDRQRQATKDAGGMAGLDVVRIINEPTAAALAYGLDKENIHTILVWDLGGGTFDVSILELGDGMFEVKAVSGDTWLGGDDWDRRIADYLVDTFRKEHGVDLKDDERAFQRVREAAERAKIELSTASATNITLSLDVPVDLPGRRGPLCLETTLSRAKLKELTADLLMRMVGPTRQALADAELEPEDIDRVVLVGGATRMPAVQGLARRLLGKEPYRDIDPDEVVAIGAAIQADVMAGGGNKAVLVDVTPLSLGIETEGGIFARIIERNTSIPVSRGQIFTTACDDQTEVDIHVLQGERDMACANVSLGRFELVDISPAPRGTPQVEVVFHIDANGIVHVRATDIRTGNEKAVKIASPRSLPEYEVQRMIEDARVHAEEDRRWRENMARILLEY